MSAIILLVKEYHRLCRWFQKAFATPSPTAAVSLPCVRGPSVRF